MAMILEESETIVTEDIPTNVTSEVNISIKYKRRLLQLLKEPFLHFILLGLVVYFIADYINERKDKNRFAIEIADADVLRIAALWEKQYGTLPSKKELSNLVDNYIREEIFYREGTAMGLDREDEVIRRRIAQKYEFLQQDLLITDEPSEADLTLYFEQNKERYRTPEKISFTHVFFSPDKPGEQNAISRAKQVRSGLVAKKISRAPEEGDNFPFLYDYADINATELARLLGDAPLSREAFALEPNEWSHPLKSGYGYHLVNITEKIASGIPDYNAIKAQLRADYIEDQRLTRNEEAYQKLQRHYSINKPEIHELNP